MTKFDQLDEKRQVWARKEQAALRDHLFGRAGHGTCSLCGEKLPVHLIVAAHIKPRAQCSEKERRDFLNIVPMCLLGCDALFERRYVAVVNGKVVFRLPEEFSDSRLLAIRKVLREGGIPGWTPERKKYFDWHSKQ